MLKSSSVSTVLLVAHADRGHFNWCIPMAKHLKKLGLSVELWTNGMCESWVPVGTMDSIESSQFGDGNKLHTCIGLYKATVQEGDSDAEGYQVLLGDGMRRMKENLAKVSISFEDFPTVMTGGAAGQDAFKARLEEPDVAFVAWEGVWGKHAGIAAQEAGKPHMGFMPSYMRPFRAAYLIEPLLDFDGSEKVRNTHEDINEWAEAHDVAFMLAECLQGKAKNTAGHSRFGFFLLPSDDTETILHDKELEEWIAEDSKVVVVSCGSQSTLNNISAWAEADLLKGCLAASSRVLVASPKVPDDPELQNAVVDGRLRASAWLPLFAVLGQEHVGCIVSHCGSNSTHEALAQGKAIVPLPCFDDQYYIALVLEDLMGYSKQSDFVPLRKAMLRSTAGAGVAAVQAAVQKALEVPKDILDVLKESVWKENGALKAAEAVKAKIEAASKLQ